VEAVVEVRGVDLGAAAERERARQAHALEPGDEALRGGVEHRLAGGERHVEAAADAVGVVGAPGAVVVALDDEADGAEVELALRDAGPRAVEVELAFEAERELEAALSLSPSFARARVALGTVLLRDGRRDDARRAFDEASHDAQDPVLRNLALSLRDRLTTP